jgi:hypothetical protein
VAEGYVLEDSARHKGIQCDYLISIFDSAGTFLAANDTMRRWLEDHGVEEIVGMTLYDVCPRQLADARVAMISEAISTGQTKHVLDALDGRQFEGMIIPIMNGDEASDRALCITLPLGTLQTEPGEILELKRAAEILEPIS